MLQINLKTGKVTHKRDKPERKGPLNYYPMRKRFSTELLIAAFAFLTLVPAIPFFLFCIYALFAGLFGNISTAYAVLYFLILTLFMVRILFILDAVCCNVKEWPKCPKDGKRLKVESRTIKGGKIYTKMVCPHGNHSVTFWDALGKRRGYRGRVHTGGFGGGGFRGGFGGGRFGGGGIGR